MKKKKKKKWKKKGGGGEEGGEEEAKYCKCVHRYYSISHTLKKSQVL